MKTVIEAMGELAAEVVGGALVLGALAGAVVAFRAFGDMFISYFL